MKKCFTENEICSDAKLKISFSRPNCHECINGQSFRIAVRLSLLFSSLPHMNQSALHSPMQSKQTSLSPGMRTIEDNFCHQKCTLQSCKLYSLKFTSSSLCHVSGPNTNFDKFKSYSGLNRDRPGTTNIGPSLHDPSDCHMPGAKWSWKIRISMPAVMYSLLPDLIMTYTVHTCRQKKR